MRQKLAKFTRFANELLPHELEYLSRIEQFEDEERLQILQQLLDQNAPQDQSLELDKSIDKRKYSHLKNWIKARLEEINVDRELSLLAKLEQSILTDTAGREEEKELDRRMKKYGTGDFYYRKFYSLCRTYADYLLIRLRTREYHNCLAFLRENEPSYEKNQLVASKLRSATEAVVLQDKEQGMGDAEIEDFLSEVFYDDAIDGFNRYQALVRLTFLLLEKGELSRLLEHYDYLDRSFIQGKMYSPRLLLNYYNNRLLIHSRRREYDKAEFYGRLAIRSRNVDYLMYLNNLSAILIRNDKAAEAMQLMQDSMSEMKASGSFFNRSGFVNYYARALMKLGEFKRAENYLETWLRAYRKDILSQRWHMFFTTYLECLLHRDRSEKVLRTVKRFKLLEKESRSESLPAISWYHQLALYKEGYITESRLLENWMSSTDWSELLEKEADNYQIKSLREFSPALFSRLKAKLQHQS